MGHWILLYRSPPSHGSLKVAGVVWTFQLDLSLPSFALVKPLYNTHMSDCEYSDADEDGYYDDDEEMDQQEEGT